MSYIDLKEINDCKVKMNGKVLSIVSLYTNTFENKYYVVIAGGSKIEIDIDTHSKLNVILDEHYKKHIFKKNK